MARSRNIKPGFYKNEDLADCSIWARYIYPGLWMLADREGRLEDRPKRIKAELLPMDSQDVEPLLAELAGRGFIVRYQVDGQALICIPAFLKHQNPHHREQPSELPPHPSLGLEPDGKDTKPEASPSMGSKPGASTPLQGGQAVLNPSSLIPDSLSSDSMTSEAGASSGKSVDQLTEAELWKAGVDLLTSAGMSEKQARPFLGKLAKDHTSPALMQAISAAVVAQPVDPAAYIRAACREKPRANRQEAQESPNRTIAQAWAEGKSNAGARRAGNLQGLDYQRGLNEDGTVAI